MRPLDATKRTLHVEVENWPLRAPFRISGSTVLNLDVVVVTLAQHGHSGRGEAAGVDYRKDDDIPTMMRQIETLRASIEAGGDRQTLQRLLPAGGARNALDCALWELQAKQAGRAAWQIADLPEPQPLLTTYTLGANDPAAMAAGARAFAGAQAIKIKLTGEAMDAERVRAVREARPDVWLGIDANQGFTRAHFKDLLPILTDARVELVEQPFPVGHEPTLDVLKSPIPIAADESAQGLGDLPSLVGRFDVVNIKLDKCGGLTEALLMAREARRLGFGAMVGNMLGTSLAMAPAFLVGQLCSVVDLDGAVLLRTDRLPGAVYTHGRIWCDEKIWGGCAGR
jgi:L-alanine-DL-glutamate epimerase-like enolase superfamily enzyme